MRVPAGPGTVFASMAFDGQAGGSITVRKDDREVACTVVAAEVTEGGAAACLTIEAPAGTLPQSGAPAGSYSIGSQAG